MSNLKTNLFHDMCSSDHIIRIFFFLPLFVFIHHLIHYHMPSACIANTSERVAH